MDEAPPDAGDIEVVLSRRQRTLVRAKIALALIAPVIALAALFLIARSTGDADAGELKDAPTAVATAVPTPTTAQAGFTNHWLS